MGGGLLQLVAYGAQDAYLTGNPQITFFKVVYRRHTNFSMEAIKQDWSGGGSKTVTATVSRTGDLICRMYLEMRYAGGSPGKAKAASGGTEGTKEISHQPTPCRIHNPGHTSIGSAILSIGGQDIDKQYGEWMELYTQLTERNSAALIGTVGKSGGTKFQNMANAGGVVPGPYFKDSRFTVPLGFWFCRNPGLALPLIALQFHEVKVKIEWNDTVWVANSCPEAPAGTTIEKYYTSGLPENFDEDDMAKYVTTNSTLTGLAPEAATTGVIPFNNTTDNVTGIYKSETDLGQLWVDYIYLDTDERQRFSQVPHEYLIEQVTKHQPVKSARVGMELSHPVKEIIFTGNYNKTTGALAAIDSAAGSHVGGDASAQVRMRLTLNGHDRFGERYLTYFTRTQIWQHHTGTPVTGSIPDTDTDGQVLTSGSDRGKETVSTVGVGNNVSKNIGVYSFAIKPEEHQPSGSCNFSRIDRAALHFTHDVKINIYAINYNILRVVSGMGGLAYSN